MRYVLIALSFLGFVSTASAQAASTQQIFLKSKAIEVPSAERLDGNINACRKVAVRDQMSCRADMTVQRDSWSKLVELTKHAALADIVGQDRDAQEARNKAWSLYVTILERDYIIRREWADVVGWK